MLWHTNIVDLSRKNKLESRCQNQVGVNLKVVPDTI